MGTISAIFSVLTIIVGGVCIMLFVSTKTLRDSRDDMDKRITQLEKERVEDKALIASQKTEIEIWRKAVTGEAQLDAISVLLNQHHAESVTSWTQINMGLGHVGRTLDSVDGSLATLVEKMGGESE